MATIYDVAHESGVSITAVSLVLNKRPHTIGTRTQQRIVDAAKRLNYQQAGWAKGSGKSTWKTITVLFNTVEADIVTNPYANGILCGVFPAAAQAGYQVIVMTTTWEFTKGLLPAFREGCTNGVLIVAPPTDSTIVSGIARSGVPLLVVNGTTTVRRIPSVDIDNRQVARLAVEHLLALGHRRIGMIMGPLVEQSVAERRAGFLGALAEAGIVPPGGYLAAGTYDQKGSVARVDQMLSQPVLPTALFCSNDCLAWDVYGIAKERGIRIPKDLSVVGCDDYGASAAISPPLTTVYHPHREIGEVAVRRLIARIERKKNGPKAEELSATQRIPVTLSVRASTAPAPPE